MMRTLACALAVTFFASPSLANDDDSQSLDDIPHITIVGSAHVEIQPDLATITIGVLSERPTALAATDDIRNRATAVIKAAKAAGVPNIDIATRSFTLNQVFDSIKDQRGNETGRRPRGFSAENTVAIKLRDLAKAGSLAENLVGNGANRFDGIEFSIEHPESITNKLIGSAVRDARVQAEIATEAAGVRLGRVLTIARPSDTAPAPGPFYRRKMASASAAVPIEPGTTSFNADVEVTWAIEPR